MIDGTDDRPSQATARRLRGTILTLAALTAVSGVIRASGGTFETLRNPVDDMDANAYSYNTTVPADA